MCPTKPPYSARNTIYPPAAVDLGKPRSCREFLPHYWFPLSKLFHQLVFCTNTASTCASCATLLFLENFLLKLSHLVSFVPPWHLRETGRGEQLKRRSTLFTSLQTNLSWNSKLNFVCGKNICFIWDPWCHSHLIGHIEKLKFINCQIKKQKKLKWQLKGKPKHNPLIVSLSPPFPTLALGIVAFKLRQLSLSLPNPNKERVFQIQFLCKFQIQALTGSPSSSSSWSWPWWWWWSPSPSWSTWSSVSSTFVKYYKYQKSSWEKVKWK